MNQNNRFEAAAIQAANIMCKYWQMHKQYSECITKH